MLRFERRSARDHERAVARARATDDPERLFEAGVALLRMRNRSGDSELFFEKACKLQPDSAKYKSYYGLALGLRGRRLTEAEHLCEEAAERKYYDVDVLVNLGRVYLFRKKRRQAFETFQKALAIDPRSEKVQVELQRMGVRRPPVLVFLSRGNFLNKYLGILRSRLERKLSR